MNRVFTTHAAALLLFVVLISVSSTPVAAQSPFSSVKMELTITQQAAEWKAEAKFNVAGNEFSKTVQDLKITGNQLSFFVEIEGAQVRFTGKLGDNKLGGTLEALEKGTRIATGTWGLLPAEAAAGNSLIGKWI